MEIDKTTRRAETRKGEQRETNQLPLVRAHPFSAHPWLPNTLEPPSIGSSLAETTSTTSFIGQRPDRARNIESTPPPTYQGLGLFPDFHISIYLPPNLHAQVGARVNPFVRADLSDRMQFLSNMLYRVFNRQIVLIEKMI